MKRLLAVFMIIGALFLSAGPALANSLVATSPIAGSTLAAAPSVVTITAEVALMDVGNSITVTDPSGIRVDDGTLTVDGVSAVVGMRPITATGIYTVTYSLLADNDVPLAGKFTFNYSIPSVVVPSTPVPTTVVKSDGSNFRTNLLVVFSLLASVGVLIALSRYARKLYKER